MQTPPVVVLSEKAKMLGMGTKDTNGKEELIVAARDNNNNATSATAPPRPATRDVKRTPRQQQRRSLGRGAGAAATKTVSFDQFGQWFLALNSDIAHRHQVQARTHSLNRQLPQSLNQIEL